MNFGIYLAVAIGLIHLLLVWIALRLWSILDELRHINARLSAAERGVMHVDLRDFKEMEKR